MCSVKKFILLIIFLVINLGNAQASDSLQQALDFHQSSRYQKALPILISLAKKYKANNEAVNYALCQLKIADIVRTFGGANLAIEMLNTNEKLLEIRLEKPSLELAQNFIAKGEAFYAANKLTEFKQVILKSISVKKKMGLPEKYLAEDYLHLARYYKEFQNQSDSCYYWASKSLRLTKTNQKMTEYLLPRIYNLIGYHFHPASFGYFRNQKDLFNERLKISRKYYDSALHVIESQSIKDELMLGRIYQNLGNSYNNQYQADSKRETMSIAMDFYKKSTRIYEQFGSPSDLSMKDWIVGKGYERILLHDSAILQFQKGLMRLVPGFDPKNVNELPLLQPTLNDQRFISLITIKANNLYYRAIAKKSVEDLEISFQHYEYLLKFHRYLLSHSLHENETINWSYLYSANAYQQLLNAAFELFRITGNAEYLTRSYSLIASAKYAWINKNDIEPALGSAINASILIEETILVKSGILKSIPSLSDSLLASILPEIPHTISARPRAQLLLANLVLDTVSVEKVKQLLGSENAALIDFYLRGEDLFTVIVTEDKFEVLKQALPPNFNATLREINKNILHLKPESYVRLSNRIYRETLDSAILKLPKEITRLIICSDGQLQTIPWDALVTDTIQQSSFKELDYLLKRFTIRTVLTPRHLFNGQPSKNGFYGVAPAFSKSKRFSAIPFSASLVKKKSDNYNVEFRTTLQQDSIWTGIFHIASHVAIDSLRPYHSAIYFSDDDSITISQLSNLQIQPQLAILNGCQTGNGTYYHTEGTISFARSFYNMGAQSVLMTLWSVDDKTTAKILESFYDEIENNNLLDASLHKAKIDFIANASSDELANPYYWAGLQLSGKADPVNTNEFSWKQVTGVTIVILVGFMFYAARKRKEQGLVNRL